MRERVCVCASARETRTSARVVLDQELVERHPAAAHAHHDGGAQDADQAQLLRVSELPANIDVTTV